MAQFEFYIFGVSFMKIPFKINSVRDFGHERFAKPHAPVSIFVISYKSPSVAASIGGIIVGAIVIN